MEKRSKKNLDFIGTIMGLDTMIRNWAGGIALIRLLI
jgi:hypothetical protein